jgi:hypothetical protein
MENMAKQNPELYAWRDNAINIYVNNGTKGGLWRRDSIIIGSEVANSGMIHLHEICHYLNLYHTQGIQQGLHRTLVGTKFKIPGDDKVDDTIFDLPQWDRDDIAKYNFSRKYHKLDARQRQLVDNVAQNIMSFHYLEPIGAELNRLTEGQLDRLTAALDEHVNRVNIRDGRTWFVDLKSSAEVGTGRFAFKSLQPAIDKANPEGGDIIMLRPGDYVENITISKPVTLRATRKGPATIAGDSEL